MFKELVFSPHSLLMVDDFTRKIKCVVDGLSGSGKSQLITAFIDDPHAVIDPNTPTWAEKTLLYDNEYISLQLWERTSSTYDRLTYLAHPGAQVYVLCISIVDFTWDHYDNLIEMRIPEIRHFSPNIPILLVGTKIDLEDDEAALERLRYRHQGPLGCEQGIGLASHLGLMGYLECSALTKEGVREVFEQSVKLAIS